MNIFSELLQRKPRAKPIEFEFMSFKEVTYEPTEAPSPKTLISSVSCNNLSNFNVRDHYRMLKKEARSRHNNEEQFRRGSSFRKQAMSFCKQPKFEMPLQPKPPTTTTNFTKPQRLSFLCQSKLPQQFKPTKTVSTTMSSSSFSSATNIQPRLRYLQNQIKAIGKASRV